MGDKIHSMADVSSYLHATVCMYKGEPVYVTVTSDQALDTVTTHPLSKGRGRSVDYTSDDFDYSSVPLGYMNFMGRAYYVKRVPDRRIKQGISTENLTATPTLRGGLGSSILCSMDMYNCIMGVHPTFSEAVKAVEAGICESKAFHRTLALGMLDTRTLGLYFKGRLVAHRPPNKEFFMLMEGEDRSFISIIAKREGVPC